MLTENEWKEIKPGLDYLEEYDCLGDYPDGKRRVCITLSNRAVEKLKGIKNRSMFVESLILDKNVAL